MLFSFIMLGLLTFVVALYLGGFRTQVMKSARIFGLECTAYALVRDGVGIVATKTQITSVGPRGYSGDFTFYIGELGMTKALCTQGRTGSNAVAAAIFKVRGSVHPLVRCLPSIGLRRALSNAAPSP